ncbi:MAG: LamB/YcsF family protein, partial [Chlorobia bacterium]|nr:LamB/YcsF family protein [Fimbriimonadaceae bacterium]
EALLEFATSANVCCGEHAGSWELTKSTVELCKRMGKRYGMHPGYPDRASIGRRSPTVQDSKEYVDNLFEQLWRCVAAQPPSYVKPHGAFYNDTATILPSGWNQVTERSSLSVQLFPETSFLAKLPCGSALLLMAEVIGCLMGLPGTAHEEFAKYGQSQFIREGFADRAYRPDGTLVPRSEPGAVLEDPKEIKAQVLELAPQVDSICLHGDTPDCLEFAELVYKTLTDNAYEVGY